MKDAMIMKDAALAQTLGQLQPFIAAFSQECLGQLASFEADFAAVSLQW